MKIRDVLDYVIELQEPAFSETVLMRWLNQVEAEIQTEVLLLAVDGIVQYSAEDLKEGSNTELIVPAPFSKLYEDYLLWRIALGQGEAERANNLETIYHNSYLAYVRFVCGTIDPGSGNAERMRYYLTAYQIAVKLGFVGSEEEWIKSLKGDDGEIGAGLEITDQVLTEEELPALTNSMSDIGKAYLVGEGIEALLYIWNGTDWFYKQHLGTVGPPGADGVSPTIEVTEITGGHRLTITDKTGTKNVDIMDGEVGSDGSPGATGEKGADGVGIKNIVFKQNTTAGNVYTINLTDGSSYDFTAPVGPKGADGSGGTGGGGSGEDGVGIQSIQLKSEADTGNTYTIILTDGSTYDFVAPAGPSGKDGSNGEPGQDGTSVTVASVTESVEDGGTNVVTFSDGKKLNVKNGSKGADGYPGAPGEKGERGVTFTPSVDADGNLSWSNDGGLENPATVNIKGPEAEFDESQIDNIVFITVEDIDEICNPQPDEPDVPDVPTNTFQKVRAFQDGKEYILLFGYNGGYYCMDDEISNEYTVAAVAVPEVTSTDAQITFATVPVLYTARASGNGFTLHSGSNNLVANADSNSTSLKLNTDAGTVFTVDTSATGGFDSDEIVPKVDDQAVWLRASFEAGNTCLKFEADRTAVGVDYKDRNATYSTGFLSFVLYEKIS